MLQKISISNKCCSLDLSTLKIKQQKCFYCSKSAY